MIKDLAKLAIESGGSVTPITIPSEISKGTGLCNPSINKIDGKLKLNLRHIQYTLYHSEGNQNFPTQWGPLAYLNPEDDMTLTTQNFICDLDSNTLNVESFTKVDTSKLDVDPLWEFVGLEDARLVKWNGREYLCGVRRDTTTNGEGRMELSEIVDNKEIARYRIEPPNGYSYCEKNWMPINDMPFHFVKWSNPTEVVKVDLKNLSSKVVSLGEDKIDLPRDLRGGSQVIKHGENFIALTHEVDLFFNEPGQKDAQYYHRFIVWDKDWNIINTTDEFKFFNSQVEFSCGMVIHNNHLLISVGFQDNTSYIVQLPMSFFQTLLGEDPINPIVTTSNPTPKLIQDWVMDPLNPNTNFILGESYFQKKQTASALSLFLRAAEFGVNDDTTYEALIRVAQCLSSQGRRDTTEKSAYQNAITFQPQRPEAYFFLSQYFESRNNWFEANIYSSLALSYISNLKKTTLDMGVSEEYMIRFQHAVTCWWVGQSKKSREIFFDLAHNYSEVLNDKYKGLVQQNITSLGSGPDPFLKYTKLNYPQLKHKFKGSENIKGNHSQTYQDMFILTALDGKKNGKYLEIGAADPIFGSNTALLEKQFGWEGMSIEILDHEVEKFKKERSNPIYLGDATKIDYRKFISDLNMGKEFDYLQVDCEPPGTTYDILTMIPFDEYKFAVITYEHDYYADVTRKYRGLSREYLTSKGYELVVTNISPNDNCPYEDWWVHPDLVERDMIEKLKSVDDSTKNAEKYMLSM